MNTTAVISKISFIDGAKGILRYRGYPIEQLADKANFIEVGLCRPAAVMQCTRTHSAERCFQGNIHIEPDSSASVLKVKACSEQKC